MLVLIHQNLEVGQRYDLHSSPARDHHLIPIGPGNGKRIICHAAAPRQPSPADLSRGSDLKNDIERSLGGLGDGNAIDDAICKSVGCKTTTEIITIRASRLCRGYLTCVSSFTVPSGGFGWLMTNQAKGEPKLLLQKITVAFWKSYHLGSFIKVPLVMSLWAGKKHKLRRAGTFMCPHRLSNPCPPNMSALCLAGGACHDIDTLSSHDPINVCLLLSPSHPHPQPDQK
jgi:hypothetical protein